MAFDSSKPLGLSLVMMRICGTGACPDRRSRKTVSQWPEVKSRNIGEPQQLATTRRVGEVRLETIFPQVVSAMRNLHPILPVQAVVHAALCSDGLRRAQVPFEPARGGSAALAMAGHALDRLAGELDRRLATPADGRDGLKLVRHWLSPRSDDPLLLLRHSPLYSVPQHPRPSLPLDRPRRLCSRCRRSGRRSSRHCAHRQRNATSPSALATREEAPS